MIKLTTTFINKHQLMIFSVCIIVLILLGYSVDRTRNTSENKRVTTTISLSLPELKSTFEKMGTEAKWDLNKPLVWGYYFYDKDPAKLEKLKKKLEEKGFKVYQVRKSAYFIRNNYLLYAYEEVTHTPESLFDQCNRLANLAIENGIEEFDGWEAGKEPL